MPSARLDTRRPEAPTYRCCMGVTLPASGRPAVTLARMSHQTYTPGRLRLGLNLGYWGTGGDGDNLALAREADRLGYSVAWAAEAYGSDAVTVLSWVPGPHTQSVPKVSGSAPPPACRASVLASGVAFTPAILTD